MESAILAFCRSCIAYCSWGLRFCLSFILFRCNNYKKYKSPFDKKSSDDFAYLAYFNFVDIALQIFEPVFSLSDCWQYMKIGQQLSL